MTTPTLEEGRVGSDEVVGVDVKVKQQQQPSSNVNTAEKLEGVPVKFLSGDNKRPLLSMDAAGNQYKHYLTPMIKSAMFILVVEGLERFCFYGVSFTQTSFMLGAYNDVNQGWSPNFSTTEAVGLTSIKMGLFFTYPIFGAIIADVFLGNYLAILLSTVFLYLPGLLMITLMSKPYLLGETFPVKLLYAAYLFFYPCGAGAIKSCVNVMGAQQFHPVLQKGGIEKFYVNMYVSIHIGSLFGGLIVPTVVNYNPFAGYMTATVLMSLAIVLYVSGSSKYVKVKPDGKDLLTVLTIACKAVFCLQGIEKQKVSNGGCYQDEFAKSAKQLGTIIPVVGLLIPFNMVWGQLMAMVQAQGVVMNKVGFVDAAWMQNFDAFGVVLAGFIVAGWFYPYFERKTGKQMKLSTKYIIGNCLGTLGMIYAFLVEICIVRRYNESGQSTNIFWQAPAFLFIGFGEIFATVAAYEATFLIGPNKHKALAMATNIFLTGVASYLNKILIIFTTDWFVAADGSTNLSTLASYASAHVYKYFGVLVGISFFGLFINMLPSVDRFLERTIAQASEELGEGLEAANLMPTQRSEDVSEASVPSIK